MQFLERKEYHTGPFLSKQTLCIVLLSVTTSLHKMKLVAALKGEENNKRAMIDSGQEHVLWFQLVVPDTTNKLNSKNMAPVTGFCWIGFSYTRYGLG
jgi:hypothetical protein